MTLYTFHTSWSRKLPARWSDWNSCPQ